MSNLELRVGDDATGYPRIGSAIQASVQDILAPTIDASMCDPHEGGVYIPPVKVLWINIIHKSVIHEDVVWCGFPPHQPQVED